MFGYRLLAIGYIFKESAEQSALFLTLFAAIWKKNAPESELLCDFLANVQDFLYLCGVY
jgi:hypothetical protein